MGVLGLALLGLAVLSYAIIRALGPGPAWQNQPPAAEGRDNPEPDAHCVAAHEHLNGVVFSPHRYPERTGMQVTAVIHHGYSGIRIPVKADSRWMTSPPSEAMF
jgi:hypothetical protein